MFLRLNVLYTNFCPTEPHIMGGTEPGAMGPTEAGLMGGSAR